MTRTIANLVSSQSFQQVYLVHPQHTQHAIRALYTRRWNPQNDIASSEKSHHTTHCSRPGRTVHTTIQQTEDTAPGGRTNPITGNILEYLMSLPVVFDKYQSYTIKRYDEDAFWMIGQRQSPLTLFSYSILYKVNWIDHNIKQNHFSHFLFSCFTITP